MERREITPHSDQVDVKGREDACEIIKKAFTEDPELFMSVDGSSSMCLYVKYSNSIGSTSELVVYPAYVESEESEIMDTTIGLPDEILSIFFKESQPAKFYLNQLESSFKSEKAVYKDPKLELIDTFDTIRRVNSLLKSTKKYLEIFSLYTTYFNKNRSGLDVPVDRLWITNPNKGYKGGNLHTLNMVNQMLRGEMPISFENYGYDRVPIMK